MKILLEITTKEANGGTFTKEVKSLKKIGKDNITYTYIDELGKNIITILDSSVAISRKGEATTDILLKKGRETSISYASKYLTEKFRVFTKNLEIKENGFKGEYSIYLNKELVNEILISIQEKQ